MKFSEIANRLTGISTPVGGVSWQPAELEIAGARRVVAFLEDRRVLYDPCEMEVPDHCVRSVLDIRHHLSEELGKLDGGSELAASLRAMRAACRKFLERGGTDGRDGIRYAVGSNVHSWTFGSALGELRGTFGVTWRRSPPSSISTWRTSLPLSYPPMPTLTRATMTVSSGAFTCSELGAKSAAYGIGLKPTHHPGMGAVEQP